jgi:ribosomal-protein-alanine N-acetyltransferase
MEIANRWGAIGGRINGVRTACQDDAQEITALLRYAAYAHLHADWHYPGDWLGNSGFVVAEKNANESHDRTLADRLFGSDNKLRACLAVAADPPPAAWVRVAAVSDSVAAPELLAAMFADLHDRLINSSVTTINWLLIETWPAAWLEELGFTIENYVETFIKHDGETPVIREISGLLIRPVMNEDLPTLEQIEAEAFEPLWRHSAHSLSLAQRQALSFDVAEYHGAVVGYQFSTPVESGVHLARMTIQPAFQKSGIGTQLLAHTCAEYSRLGFENVTLNTQSDNLASQKLYRRFGFQPNGQRFPVWVASL